MRLPPVVDTTQELEFPPPAKQWWGAAHSLDVSRVQGGKLDFCLPLEVKMQCFPISPNGATSETKSARTEGLNKIQNISEKEKKISCFNPKLPVIPGTWRISRSSVDANTEMTGMLGFSGKDSKACVIWKMLRWAIMNMFGANNKIASHRKETQILPQQKIRRCKKASSKDFRTDR